MNNYFLNIVPFEENIILPESENYQINHPLELKPTNTEEICGIIKQLNLRSSNGYDGISARFIIKYMHQLKIPLVKFINECFSKGTYPKELKIGSVVPILKKGSPQNCSNYRPITKLSVVDKILEEVILRRLKLFLEKNEIINKNQFGFVSNSNTLAASISCMENIYKCVDEKKFVGILSIDLARAFDSIHPRSTIKKLNDLQITGKELSIFEDFLTNREQFVEINEQKSNLGKIKMGVPQGSKLAGTLFIIYINGIFNLNLKGEPRFYADDGTFVYEAKTNDELINKIAHDIKLIKEWCEKNFLKLNVDKTKFIIFENHRTIPSINEFPGINFENKLIERVLNMNYLGLTIDYKLNWNSHIEKIKNKIIPMSFAIKKVSGVIPTKQLWMIYHAYIMSHIAYLNPIWTNCNKNKINELQRIQNRIIKSIERKKWLTPTNTLYTNRHNIESFSKFQMAMIMHKIALKKIKCDIEIRQISDVQNNFLRNIMNFRPAFFTTEKTKGSLLSRGLNIYNKIPYNIREIVDVNKYKKEINRIIIEKNN